MKRILVVILSLLYMASATGATVHMHYCMGEFMSASLSHNEDKVCGKCGMKKTAQKKGCCKDEHKTFKTADHQMAKASFDLAHASFYIALLSHYAVSSQPVYAGIVTNLAQAHAPPSLWRTCPIYIQVQDFRI